ncbi:uncharacterized protein LOC129223335 [Uloborus diversus]|uniref:uncharacterized protein LOC129223335 n=1 Tax=Uloborus diversus TaxID=327109 RepID=UPI00240A351D|nr:uncharacterized protein LOC129223335 [Uloborus diversus]
MSVEGNIVKTAAELNKFKAARKTIRIAVTKLVNCIESGLQSETFDRNAIEENLYLLNAKESELKILNEQIFNCFVGEEAEIEKEYSSVLEYEEKISLCQFRTKKKLDSISNAVQNQNQSTGDHIVSCKNEIEKFTYLKSLLGGAALNAVSGFSLSDENYDACIGLIKERFGRVDLVISSHMNNLLNLDPVKHSSNVKALRTLYDSCEINIRSLNSLGIVSESYGSLLGPIILKLLPDDMNLEFNRKRNSKKQYNVTELLDFIRLEVESLEASNVIINSKKRKSNSEFAQNKNNYSRSVPTTSALTTMTNSYCYYCNENTHDVRKCEKTNEQKRMILKNQGRCYKCFRKGHVSFKCRVKIPPCKVCNSVNHNKLFCRKIVSDSEDKENAIASLSLNSKTISETADKGIYLQTCTVHVSDKNSLLSRITRILLDSGSQKTFIKSELAKELKLKCIRREKLYIYSFGYIKGKLKEYDVVEVKLKSMHEPNSCITIEALVTDTISGALIKVPPRSILEMLKTENLKLADNGESSEIELLLGSDSCWEVQTGQKKRISKRLFAVSSLFGWSLVGAFGENQSSASMFTIGATQCESENHSSINDSLRKFWALDHIGLEEKDDKNDELVIKNDEWLRENYDSIINDQLRNKIIEECGVESHDGNTMYYMPHSPVVRKNASKTKVRIVYDASSKVNDEVSLNQCLIPGPNLNPSILDLILCFRQFKYAFSADIEKAFHQIGIVETDRDALRFLYFDNELNIKHYRMTRAPFGVACSSFILACTIKHHIKKLSVENPEIFKMLNNFIYVDDIFYGSDSVEHAFKLSTEAYNVLKEAGMNLRQFSTNSEELEKIWDKNGIVEVQKEHNDTLKVLGLNWCNSKDVLFLNIDKLSETLNKCRIITKRNILKVTATIFDPVGFISPFVLRAKLIMQNLWQLGLELDDEVPIECKQMWSEWCDEIETLKKFEICREYFPCEINRNKNKELHIFGDASIKAYGSVAYLRSVEDCTVAFVMAKSKIAPIKQKLTLPRLELLAALTTSKLAKYLKDLFSIQEENIYLWTDSQIVIHWIRSAPERWKLFVKNRVSEIQSLTKFNAWGHCSGSDNPSDILSRGCSAEHLLSSKLWKSGPDWLSESKNNWPKKMPLTSGFSDVELEKKKCVAENTVLPSVAVNSDSLLNLEKYSKLSRAVRVTAWIQRFIYNVRCKADKKKGPLRAEELFAAELSLIKEIQHEHFSDEITCLKQEHQISRNSKIRELNPFLSEEGILLVGGRLQKSTLSFYEKHPIIIPSKTHFTEILVRDAHEKVFHSGMAGTLGPMQQDIAPLPSARIEKSNPFDVIGVDYAGPLFVKNEDTKYYILLITCAVTRGIHLELTKNLTTESFLQAFRRFVSRKGLCSVIYSDNARTFKAADAELKKMWQVLSHPDVKNFYAAKGIQWRYIVEKGAWWGGFYERLVRSVKTMLRKTLGRASLHADELETVLIEIESVINHRPLTYIEDDQHEYQVLSPAHFLLGNKPLNLPPAKYTDFVPTSNRKIMCKTYQYRERLLNRFWKLFYKDYLLQLKSVNGAKNHKTKTELNVNDIVVIREELLPRNMWRLGKVVKTFTGRDGLIRSCEIKTERGILKRPVQLLVKLECE